MATTITLEGAAVPSSARALPAASASPTLFRPPCTQAAKSRSSCSCR